MKQKKNRLNLRGLKNYLYICTPKSKTVTQGEVPEWSIGPHSKCGVRATVPGVRIPLFPPQRAVIFTALFLWCQERDSSVGGGVAELSASCEIVIVATQLR